MTNNLLMPDIALQGAPGAGKTTAAEWLRRERDYFRVSFAGFHKGGLRDVAVRLWGPEAAQDRDKLDSLNCIREFDPAVWTRSALAVIDERAHAKPIAIDDMRTPLERQELRARGFVFIRVEAPEYMRIDRLKASGKFTTMEALVAPIQVALNDYPSDYTVYSEGPKDELYEQLSDILHKEMTRRA